MPRYNCGQLITRVICRIDDKYPLALQLQRKKRFHLQQIEMDCLEKPFNYT